MPPCAQTECERFTGTTENRSTFPPLSAILMTAANPASPPPTTMIFGAAILLSYRLSPDLFRCTRSDFDLMCSSRIHRLLRKRTQFGQTSQPNAAQHKEKHQAR